MKQERIEKYLESLSKIAKKKGIMLDAGCGSGNNSLWKNINIFDRYLKIGVDLNPFDNKKVDYTICGDLYNLPFKNTVVDIIVCEMVAEHLKTPEFMISEFHRVLKKKGSIIIFTPNKFHPIFFLANLLPQKFVDYVKVYYYNIQKRENFDVYYKFNDFSVIKKTCEKYFVIRELYACHPAEGFDSNKLLLRATYNIYKKLFFIFPEKAKGGLIVTVLEK